MSTANINDFSLHDLYYNTKKPTAYSSKKTLADYLKRSGEKGALRVTTNWLQGEKPYTLHKPRKINFRRNKYGLTNIGDFWQADLMDLQSLSRKNKGFKYILTVIDCFSKFGWCIPIKKKQPADVITGFKRILDSCQYKPRNLHTDQGREFVNKPFQEYLRQNNIIFYKAVDPATKASICERYIRTMKSLMFRYFTHIGAERYYDVLESLVTLYNNRHHRSIGMAPSDVNERNILQVWKNLNRDTAARREPRLTCGDFVRLAKPKGIFDKGYKPLWTDEIFTVHRVIPHNQPVYRLKDLAGDELTGQFYEPELQKITRRTD